MTSSEQQKEQLVLVDGSGYIFRAFHGLPMMNRADGTPINAVFGFTKMLMKLSSDLQPSHIAVIFDAGRRTFRNDIYPDYKANRSEPPDELVPQFALVRDATNALGLPAIEMAGFEADDIIASYVKYGEDNKIPTTVYSSDKDLFQLLSNNTRIMDPMKNVEIDEARVLEKFGVGPDKITDVQALIGDSVDNIPGVPGIGPKTAQRVVLDLKDKAPTVMAMTATSQPVVTDTQVEEVIETPSIPVAAAPTSQAPASSAQADALSALTNLGYSPSDAAAAVAEALSENPDLESAGAIRAALKLLAPKGVRYE